MQKILNLAQTLFNLLLLKIQLKIEFFSDDVSSFQDLNGNHLVTLGHNGKKSKLLKVKLHS